MQKTIVHVGLALGFLAMNIFGFNHPEIQWRTVTTEHFAIHYYDRTEAAVYATWKIAEEAYESLSNLYDFSEREKISIALADYDDYSNGFANWTNESIMIWVTDSRFDLRGDNTWLRNVITHELSHIVTLEKSSRPQLLDWMLSLDYQSPHAAITLTEPVALNRFWPDWFAEGLAQRESQRAGNDSWDSRRDMLLRDAVMVSKPLSLDAMGHFNHNSVGNELVYNQGFSFITFLENKLSFQTLKQVCNDGRQTSLFVQSFSSYFHEHTGMNIELLYDQWLDSLKSVYAKQLAPDPTPVTVLWNRGEYNCAPKISRNKRSIGWLTSDKDDFGRTDLLIAPYGKMDDARRITWAKQSWDFSPDGEKIYYIKSHTPNAFGSYVNEIFARDLARGGERKLTQNARAYDVAVSPDNKSLVWIAFSDGAFSLIRAAIDGGNQQTVIQGKIGEPLLYLSFNPNDPNQLATTRLIDGVARLCVVDIASKTITRVTAATAQEETPYWADNGLIYYSADYDGISTVYSISPDGADCSRLATTGGGLFWPCLVDSATMLCTSFRNKGFSIVSFSPQSEESFDVPDSSASPFKALPFPRGKVTIRSTPYQARLLRGTWEVQTQVSVIDPYGKLETIQDKDAFRNFSDSMSYALSAGIYMSQSDALEKQSKWMGIGGALQIEGVSRAKDTSRITATQGNSAACDWRAQDRRLRLLHHENFVQPNSTSPGSSNEAASALLRSYAQYALSGATRGASSDSSGKPSVSGFLVPGIGFQTTEHTLTLGINAQGYIISAIIPAVISVSGQAQWQILRDFYASFGPQWQFYTMSLFSNFFYSMADLPLTLTWSASGYLNTDINYNFSDLSQISATIRPSFFPVAVTTHTYANNTDTTIYHSGSSMTYELTAARGFPLTRYSSLVLSAYATATHYSEKFSTMEISSSDTLLGAYDLYSAFSFSSEYVFPLIRQINSGNPYADALYGSLIYEASLFNTGALVDKDFSGALSHPSYGNRHYFVDHAIGASLKLGLTKSYTFSKICLLKTLWDIWGKRIRLTLDFTL